MYIKEYCGFFCSGRRMYVGYGDWVVESWVECIVGDFVEYCFFVVDDGVFCVFGMFVFGYEID